MADTVLPKTVFPPAVAMVGTNKHGAISEAIKQRRELAIYPFQTGPLLTSTFQCTAMLIAKGHTRAGPPLPTRSLMPIGHMGFTDIEEYKPRLIIRSLGQTLIQPFKLMAQTPGIARKIEMFKRFS